MRPFMSIRRANRVSSTGTPARSGQLALTLALAAALGVSSIAAGPLTANAVDEPPVTGAEADPGSGSGSEPGAGDAPLTIPEIPAEPLPEPDVVGNPQWDDETAPFADAYRLPTAGAPVVRSNGVTAALLDIPGNAAYAATRSGKPAELFSSRLDGTAVARKNLPVGTGSWDLAQSGKTLAIGITALPGAQSTWLQGYDTARGAFTRSVTIPNANIVMSVAEDRFEAQAGNGRYFWVGTYHPKGTRLYRVDLTAGTATLRGSWQSTTTTYVRTLAVTSAGVSVGIGTKGQAARITVPGQAPQNWSQVSGAVQGSSFVYASDASDSGPAPAAVFGTEHPARAVVADPASGAVLATHAIPDATTVDRVAIDAAAASAWFTTRPYGELWRIDLTSPGVAPIRVATPKFGSETRGLSAANGVVRGVTGTSDVWSLQDGAADASAKRIISRDRETPDSIPQGVQPFGAQLLVAGHWRYEAHTAQGSSAVEVPGEPKAQVTAKGSVFTALYPSASIYRIDGSLNATRVGLLGNGLVRPAAIEYHPGLDRLIVAAGPAYGKYGGGLGLMSTDGSAPVQVYTRPVGNLQVTAITPHEDGAFLGTWIRGEARPDLGGNRTADVRLWKPTGDATTGTTVWTRPIPNAAKVTGTALVADATGAFVLATGIDRSGGRGWIAAIDAKTGALIWQKQVTGPIFGLDSHRGYLTAQVNGTLVQLGPTRSDIALTAVKGVPGGVSPAFSALDRTNASSQNLGYTSSGTGAVANLLKLGTPRTAYRASGSTRYGTAAAVSREAFATADTVLLARSDDFADALAAGPLAAKLGAPILLVTHGKAPEETKREITRLGAKRAIPIGGKGVLPDSLAKTLPAGVQLDSAARLGGKDRYATSLAIANRLQQVSGGKKLDAMVTTGRTFADAISAGPAAITSGRAIVLYDAVPAAAPVKQYLAGRKVHALGGPSAQALTAAKVPLASKIVGADRFATAQLIAKAYFAPGDSAYLANGLDFPDGLTASVTAGRQGTPLLLARATELTRPTDSALSSGYGRKRVVLVGGSGVLSDTLGARIRDR